VEAKEDMLMLVAVCKVVAVDKVVVVDMVEEEVAVHSGSEGTDSLRKESDQKLATL
jgi:hypothetical protein